MSTVASSAFSPAYNLRFWRRAALAPCCLLLVASLHWYRVAVWEQSAWKGGGFGMFSTIDSPAARSVRIYITTEGGRFPLATPPKFSKIVSELQTAPSQARADELAAQVLHEHYVDESLQRRWLLESAGVEPPPDGLPRHLVVASPSQVKAAGAARLLSPQQANVELWQANYDRRTQLVQTTKLLTGTCAVGPSNSHPGGSE